MFKYGSFKLFLIKFLFGALGSSFGIIYLLSLLSYNENDPGFTIYSDNVLNTDITNYFGVSGSYISSYSLVIVGGISYIFAFFIISEGVKALLGIRTKFLILRLISNIFGCLIVNIFFYSYGVSYINTGLSGFFFSEILNKHLLYGIENQVLIYIINLILFVAGLFLIITSFSIKFKSLKITYSFLKYFKFVKYLNIVPLIIRIYKKKPYEKNNKIKNEPTIKKNIFFNRKAISDSTKKQFKQLEIEQFRFNLPNTDVLIKSSYKTSINRELDKINSESAIRLEKTLAEYGVDGNVIGYSSGPIVTLFEFIPSAGIKSSKVIGLSEDIARAMSSLSARISSQPGKTSLGIEIPNKKRDGVLFGDLVQDERFNENSNSLTLALGKDISGEKIFTDLEKMPHLLIAGTTGSGKSVGINTMILSLLYKFKPNECKLILIDPKMLELSIYEDIPHLLTPVVTDPKKAVFALKWVVREMENRYKLMSSVNVKNISSYNNKVLRTISSGRKLFREVQTGIDSDSRMPIIEKKEIKLEKMPFIVVVIDEMADLMMVAGKEVETLVQRLAQMARASGIHLITATQRPSVDVITGTIKANFPSRISYKVASKFDSRTILNEMGAEQLLGSGDMLFLENGANIKRLHGGFVSETEVEKVVKLIKEQAVFDYKKEISLEDKDISNNATGDLIADNNDELYNKAVEIIIKQQKVSTSYIQRYLQIGYNRAARIVEKMEEDGIISEANNAGKRHVLKKI